MRLNPLIAIAFALLLQSCGRMGLESSFIKASDAEDGVYRFEEDFSDSLATWDISFFTRISHPLMLDVRWLSPSDNVALRDSVWIEAESRNGVCALYRSGVSPEEKGVWTIEVRPADVPGGFCGLGLLKKKNGTR